MSFYTRRRFYYSLAMLLPLIPHAHVGFAPWPVEDAVAVFFIVEELSYVFATVWPGEFTISVILTLFPFSFILSFVRPSLYAEPVSYIVAPSTIVYCSIVP